MQGSILERPRIEDERETSLKQWGTSQAVRIPKAVCDAMGVVAGRPLSMTSGIDERGPFILIRPLASDGHRSFADCPGISLDELFAHADYKGDYRPTEADWDEDVGAEVIA